MTQAGSLEAQVQEQSIAELAGLTALETDLKRSAKASDSLSFASCNHMSLARLLLPWISPDLPSVLCGWTASIHTMNNLAGMTTGQSRSAGIASSMQKNVLTPVQ